MFIVYRIKNYYHRQYLSRSRIVKYDIRSDGIYLPRKSPDVSLTTLAPRPRLHFQHTGCNIYDIFLNKRNNRNN